HPALLRRGAAFSATTFQPSAGGIRDCPGAGTILPRNPGPAAGRTGNAPATRDGIDRSIRTRGKSSTMNKVSFGSAFLLGAAAVVWMAAGFVGTDIMAFSVT